MVYTGTHDNDTTLGWWKTDATEEEKRWAADYLGNIGDGIEWAFIRAAFTSVSTLAVVPVQDVLGLDGDARMNVPSKPGGNWSWRLRGGALTPDLAAKLASLTRSHRPGHVRKNPKGSTARGPGYRFRSMSSATRVDLADAVVGNGRDAPIYR